MSLFKSIEKVGRPAPLSVPELRYLSAAAERVRERWPDVQVAKTEKEREALAQKLRERVEADEWENTRLSFVVAAGSAVFDTERRSRTDLARTRDFIYAEIAASTSETLLSGLLRAYLESYTPQATHTTALATALVTSIPRMSPSGRLLLDAVPELLDPKTGSDRLAARISEMSDPYTELLRLGIRNPHGGGFMDLAHLSLTSRVRMQLSDQAIIDWYITWLRPPGKEEARTTGAEAAIEALIHPWLDKTPEDKLRSYLVETLIELYGDPRIKSGGVWGGIDPRYMAIMHRWLTREDMRFFTGVVDAVQKDNMWIKRRDFWLKLYDEGLIDAAWAALSKEGFDYARRHLMRQEAKNAYSRVGFQQARQNTSLLILKIGNKVMVDGCHSYRTHVFDATDPMAPKLFEEGYDCEEIMYASDERRPVAAKSHSSIDSWGRWVRDMINADVAMSQRNRPYRKVFRPRPPKPRYAAPYRSSGYDRLDPRPPAGIGGGNPSFDRATPSLADWGRTASPAKSTAVPRTGVTSPRAEIAEPSAVVSGLSATKSLRAKRFLSITDRMIAYGPAAAAAVLAYLEAPSDGRTRPLLSPKSREGLAWVRAIKGDLPLSLRNALEYLLLNLKTSGVDLDDLFVTAAEQSESSSMSNPNSSVNDDSSAQATTPQQQISNTKAFSRGLKPSNLTDLMTWYGPEAASTVLKFLEEPGGKSTQESLSSKSREGLNWVASQKGNLPIQMRNALEDLLISLKRGGIDLDALFAKSAFLPPTSSEKFSPMRDIAEGRIDLLQRHIDALEEIGMSQANFELRKDAVVSIKALRERPSDLLPAQIMDLMGLYNQLRQRELDELPIPPAAASASAPPATTPKADPASGDQKFPPLPDNPNGRMDLLRAHADALEDLGMWKGTFEQRKTFAIAFQKLKERSPDIRPTEIAEIQSLYEDLRQGGKGKRR